MKKHLKNIALMGITIVGVIAISNKIVDIAANANDCLPSDKGIFYHWKYGDVYYTKTGKGKPLLLIHDLNVCSSSYEWSRVIQKLSHSHTVYAIDLLGCGRSDKPNLTYTNYLYVQLINDFIKKVIGSRTSVVATGYSLAFTVMACHMENKNFDKIIGVSPCDIYKLTKTPDKKRNILKFLLDSPVMGTFLYNLETGKLRIAGFARKNYFSDRQLASDEIFRTYYKASKTAHSRGKYLLASMKSCYTNINIIPAIEKTNNSICLIGGRDQPFINEIIDEYKSHNSSIEDTYISNAGYLPQMEAPKRFVELLQILL